MFIAIVAGCISLTTLEGDLKFIFICLAFYMFTANVTNYYQIISQITNRFTELSIRNGIQSGLTCVSLVILWIIHAISGNLLSYKIYTIIYTSISVILMMWYVFTYRSITFGQKIKLHCSFKELLSFFAIGFPLLIANLCSSLILAIDRQFVNALFDTDTYAIYAFAYNMLALITTALAAISTVLYPTLKRTSHDALKNNYSLLNEAILVIVFICVIIYFPLCWFIPWFLPKYTDSLPIFRIILPGLAVSSSVTIIMHNYYKTEGKELMFFIKSIVILALSAAANIAAYLIFKTTISISIASIAVMLVWYVGIEEYFIRKYKVIWAKNLTYMIIVAGGFYLITIWNNWWATMLIYFAFLVGTTYLFYWKDINKIRGKLFKKESIDNSVKTDINVGSQQNEPTEEQ